MCRGVPKGRRAYPWCPLCGQAPSNRSEVIIPGNVPLGFSVYSVPCADCFGCPLWPALGHSSWFHETCYNLLKSSYQPSQNLTFEDLETFAVATRPFYDPGNEEHDEIATTLEGLLSKHTSSIIESSFSQDLLRRLPAELRIIIAGFIGPCWYLGVLGESRRLIEVLRNNRETQCTRLTLARELWMTRIDYRGVSYVARLSDRPLKSVRISDQYRIELPRGIKKVALSVDCIGVRRTQFAGSYSTDFSSDGSPWYEVLEAPGLQLEAHVSFNGLFVRGIQLVPDGPPFAFRVWSSPFVPNFRPWNFCRLLPRPPRLHYVKFDTHMQGLVVCCVGSRTAGIHGFSDNSRAFKKFIDLMDRRMGGDYGYWFYFPLNKHEYITAAWVQKFEDHCPEKSWAILVTSLGRTVRFGPKLSTKAHIPLVKDGDGAISGIFHNGIDSASRYAVEFGVTCSDQHRTRTMQPLPMDDHFRIPRGPQWGGPYMTQAVLKGLVKVRICRDLTRSHRPCLGMLLFYRDQHIESLGQVRWDRDLTREVPRPLYVKNALINGGNYIEDICGNIHDPELDVETRRWQKLEEDDGLVIWWFGRHGDRIITYSA